MKAGKTSEQILLDREETIAEIHRLAEKLGHDPKKIDLPPELHSRIRSVFGKWCYAQEAAGLVIPSEKVQEKRRKREAHEAMIQERQRRRAEEKRIRDAEKKQHR